MPVIEVRCSQRLFDMLGEITRRKLGNEWREAVRRALAVGFDEVGCEWHTWIDSQNMEEIEILIHFSVSDEQAGSWVKAVPVRNIIDALVRSASQSELLPRGIEVGVWQQPIPFTSYASCRVGNRERDRKSTHLNS